MTLPPSPADLLDMPAAPALICPDPCAPPTFPEPAAFRMPLARASRDLVPTRTTPTIPSVLSIVLSLPTEDLPPVHIEEAIHIDYCEERGRLLWEAAMFTLQAVWVGHGDDERCYGPRDPWRERGLDPRAAYHDIGDALVRRAEPGRDYDEARHAGG